MYLFSNVFIFFAVFVTSHRTQHISNCAYFGITSVTIDKDNNANVIFTVTNNCLGENYVELVRVFRGTHILYQLPICKIEFPYYTVHSPDCFHDNVTGTFSVTQKLHSETVWLLIGDLKHDDTFRREVEINIDRTPVPNISSTTTDKVVPPGVSQTYAETTSLETRTVPTEAVTSTTSESHRNGDVRFFLLLGFISFVLLIVVVLFAVFGVVFSRKQRARRLPPPPVPHNVRRARCGAVMFHAAQNGSDSTVSMHEYAEIPDDDDSSTHENSQRSVHFSSSSSSSVSDSSMSDCLHHIACPSSDSSLPEDYLHPVTSDWETCENTFETTIFEDFPNENVNDLPCLIVQP